MNILYLGDIMGQAGREIVCELLPSLRKKNKIDFVVAQGENVSHGKSMIPRHMKELQEAGVDFFSGGDHSLERTQLISRLNDPEEPVIRPANLPNDADGLGWKVAHTEKGSVLVVSLLGSIFPKKFDIQNPLKTIDKILEKHADENHAAIVVNLHGDYSSEKRVMGYYLDGRVTMIVGDHWHVQTSDEMILPKGTAHITDVGMCGSVHSSLGVSLESIIPRWRDDKKVKKEMALERPYQLSGLLVKGVKNGSPKSLERISIVQ